MDAISIVNMNTITYSYLYFFRFTHRMGRSGGDGGWGMGDRHYNSLTTNEIGSMKLRVSYSSYV